MAPKTKKSPDQNLYIPAKVSPGSSSKKNLSSSTDYSKSDFVRECSLFLKVIKKCETIEEARKQLVDLVMSLRIGNSMQEGRQWDRSLDRMRDCTRAILGLLSASSDEKAKFSVTQALWDISRGIDRPDLEAGFFAEIIHFVWGIEGRTVDNAIDGSSVAADGLSGRQAAIQRSTELDKLFALVEDWMSRYEHGLSESSRARRRKRRFEILERLSASPEDWKNWKWQVSKVGRDIDSLDGLVELSEEEKKNIADTCEHSIPFGVTPYYLSLMDNRGIRSRDRAIRAQVFPPTKYVTEMVKKRDRRDEAFDFMQEHDTSPIDLVTRRYPGIVILKPYNTCPQICVYCQRNWEIDEVLAPDAMASWEKIDKAIEWIGDHPAVHEVLITGGDPFLLDDDILERILDKVAALPSIKRIRLGTRTLVTLPMRITNSLAKLLGKYRVSGQREIAVVTHVEHPYEATAEMTVAVDRLRSQGIPVYNQLVYTFFVSRRFEASLLRRILRRIGIEPYYTFQPKGKSETDDYRTPLSRLLQEQTEEARLLPGLTRTDEAVYNVPRLGKNYIRASKFRDLLSVLPDGTRIYEFHPWEKNISEQQSYIGDSIPILTYLKRLEEVGESAADYESIWYYY